MSHKELSKTQYSKSNKIILLKGYKNNFSEVMYKNQLQKAEKNKQMKLNEYRELTNEEYLNELKNHITFNTNNSCDSWEKNNFDSDLIFREETPLIKMNWEEETLEVDQKGIDITNHIYRSKQTLNMEHLSVEFCISGYLIGESSIWIFNRVNTYFDEFSLVIKIEKEENSQKVFIHFGTFVKDSQDNLVFKIFLKENLIDFSKIKNKFYKENDISFFKIYIIDSCDDVVMSRIYLNDSKTENKIFTNFLIPMRERRRIMIAGIGEKCLIKSFLAKNKDLRKITTQSLMKNSNAYLFNKENATKEEKEDEKRSQCGCTVY